MERIQPPVVPFELDVRDPHSCERFVEAAIGELTGVDILVNAAGLALGRDFFDESTEEDESTVIETNVNGLIRMTFAAGSFWLSPSAVSRRVSPRAWCWRGPAERALMSAARFSTS